ncbi:signal transduction histidine kinase [Paraburkholderia sp. WC7.3g]|uniref:sensor histidine kinase n=1 Tax=Paraburkholderia sp. WC7.3g TaxID=2991070 RepID=UPI003D1A3FE2
MEVRVKGNVHGVWDAGQLGQVVSNLLGNAHHGRPAGRIVVTVDGTSNALVHVSVCNEGDPIPADMLASLFKPRGRSGKPAGNAAVGAGLGLGLFIADRIAAAHGGQVTVDSDSGRTVFTVSLPRQVPLDATSECSPQERRGPG